MSDTAIESLNFGHDELLVVMANRSADYFLDGSISGSESRSAYLGLIGMWYEREPTETRMKLAGGLLVTKFNVTFKPITVQPPSLPADEVLDRQVLATNGYQVAPTLLDMGFWAINKGGPWYDHELAMTVFSHVGFAPTAPSIPAPELAPTS